MQSCRGFNEKYDTLIGCNRRGWMGEFPKDEADGLPITYLSIDEQMAPGERGTSLETALSGHLEGMTELIRNWRQGQSATKPEDRDWNFSFNHYIYQEWAKFFHYSKETPYQAELAVIAAHGEQIYGQMLRWEKFRQSYALYGEVELASGSNLAINYFGRHQVVVNQNHNRPLWDSELTQIFVGDTDAGYTADNVTSGLVISMNQLAKTLNMGGQLVLAQKPGI